MRIRNHPSVGMVSPGIRSTSGRAGIHRPLFRNSLRVCGCRHRYWSRVSSERNEAYETSERINLMWSKDFKLSGILSEVLSDEDCVRRVLLKSQMFMTMSRILFQIKTYKETFIILGCQQRHYEPVFLSGQPG